MVASIGNLGDPHFGGEMQPLVEKRPNYASNGGWATTTLVLLAQCVWAPLVAPAAEDPVLRLDLGPSRSAVADGHVRLTAGEAYSADRGYGWESPIQDAFDVVRPPSNPAWLGPSGQLVPGDYVAHKEHNDLTRDGITSTDDLVLRADLPDGVYRVTLVLGRLDRPSCSMQIDFNDTPVASDVHARHFAVRGVPDFLYGFPRVVRRNVEVRGGSLRIRVRGDDSGFRERFLREFERPAPASYLVGIPTRNRKPVSPELDAWGRLDPRRGTPGGGVWVYADIGCPFTENALAAVQIHRYRRPALAMEDGRLRANLEDPNLRSGAQLFNARRFTDAETAFRLVDDDFARALGLLWLAGVADHEHERRLLPDAIGLLEGVARRPVPDPWIGEFLEQARRLSTAVHRFDHASERQRVYTELLLITGEVDSFEPGDPLYAKGKTYAARSLMMIDPHRWAFASHVGKQIFADLESRGERSRYIDWYLHEKWSDEFPDWQFAGYQNSRGGAPAWAGEVFEAYNRELDLAEWWMRNRQQSDGSLGGGWGDDVEILRSFAAFAGASPDASPLVMDGIRALAEGTWFSGSVDTAGGYFAEVGDTEHSGEWTADTLSAMIQSDYGNPVYIERALKTAKLMRDLWMDVNSRGWFLMRSNFLGASGVGRGGRASDSRINYRPAMPALAVLRYNSLPAVERLFVRWADTWLAASMSTDRGKPRGVIPQEISFDDGMIGGVDSPSWFRAAHPPGTVNYDWGGVGSYHDSIVDLLLTAFRATSDRKYLEPMELEAEFVRRHFPEDLRASPLLSRPGPPHPDLWKGLAEGSAAWVAARLASWPRAWTRMQNVLFPRGDSTGAPLRTLAEAARMAAEENEFARRRWPHVTTEMIATDRVYFPGLGNAVRVMTGLGTLGNRPLVTYAGLGRNFAAALLSADARSLRVALYSFSRQTETVEIFPWLLDVGPVYKIEVGPDQNADGHFESITRKHSRPLAHRGLGFAVQVPPRQDTVVRVRWESGEPNRSLAADLAVSPRDIQFHPEYRRVDVTVHNIGAIPARSIEVALYKSDELVGRQLVPAVQAPDALLPATVRVGFPFIPKSPRGKFRAVVDGANGVLEISERNNEAQVDLDTPLVGKRRHAHP